MKKIIFTSLAIVAAYAASAVAADVDGSLTLGGSAANIHGQKAKANEYRNIGSGAFGDLDLNYRSPKAFLDFEGKFNLRERESVVGDKTGADSDLLIKGGGSDIAKFSLFYNEIPHNITFGAQSFLNGVGTNALSSPLPVATTPTAANTANLMKSFDYSLNRTNLGAELELSLKTPFFLTASINRTETTGLQPYSFTRLFVEMPVPVDYATDTINLQAGYRSKVLIVTVDGTVSSFRNANTHLSVGRISTVAAGTGYLPPENDYYKVGGSLTYRLPFFSTTVMAKGSHSILESNPTILGDADIPAAVRGTTWHGLVTYDSASASITSTPIPKLNLRAYYNYLKTDNASDALNYSTSASTSYNTPVARYDHSKQYGGLEASYLLPAATKVSAGYEYGVVKRAEWAGNDTLAVAGAPHATKTTDHTIFAQVKNNLLEMVSGKLRYEHQFRSSEYPALDLYLATNRMFYFRPFEAANKNMDAIKAELEFEPMHGLSIGAQYAFKMNKYTDSPLGLQDDNRHEVYVDATYAVGIAKLNLYGEVEMVEANTKYFTGTYGTPATATNNFFIDSKRKDVNYAVGGKVGVDIMRDRLSLTTGYRYESANGSNDFSLSNAAIMTTPYSNVIALDDYIKHSLEAKLTYKANKNWSFDLGYLYEHLKYSDDAYAGYNYFPVAGATNYLTGAYNNPNYDANVFYLSTKYTF